MPRESTQTREALARAAEHIFARVGVHAAQTRDIIRLAQQGNDSAVHYHFGSREGLLQAICESHIAEMEPARREALDELRRTGRTGDLAALVGAIVRPTLDQLRTESGRDFLLITAQLAGLAGVGTNNPSPLLGGTALMDQLAALELLLRQTLPRPVMISRIAAAIYLLTSCLADRARTINAGRRKTSSDAVFSAEVETMMVAVLSAPLSSVE